MTTLEEVRAEIELRREAVGRCRPPGDAAQLSLEARSGEVSALDDIWRRLGVHTLAASINI